MVDTKVLLVHGTWSWTPGLSEWYFPNSAFVKMLRSNSIEPVFSDVFDYPEPFVWDGEAGGLRFGDGDMVGWHAAGRSLLYFLVPPLCSESRISPGKTNLIAHSHGLQVALYACSQGLKVDTMISVGSPIRKDMRATSELARKNIKHWIHLYSDDTDRMQWLGALFDGHWGIVREAPLADLNIYVPKVGHSRLLRDPSVYDAWETVGLLEALRTEH